MADLVRTSVSFLVVLNLLLQDIVPSRPPSRVHVRSLRQALGRDERTRSESSLGSSEYRTSTSSSNPLSCTSLSFILHLPPPQLHDGVPGPSPVDFGRGRPTYDAHPRYPRSASTSRVPFTSHTENYIYTGTGAAVQIPQRPLQRRPSFHAPSDAFHARREAYQQARAAFIASERQYQASLMAFRATGARINSRPHAMLLQAQAQDRKSVV